MKRGKVAGKNRKSGDESYAMVHRKKGSTKTKGKKIYNFNIKR